MASSNEYTEDYGRIEPNLTDFINHILFRNDNTDNIHFNFNIRIKEIYSNNRYIIHQFDITDLNTYINRVFIDNYLNYYIIEKGQQMHIKNDIEKIDNTKYKLSNKIIDNIKKIKYYTTTSHSNYPNSRGDTIYFDMLDIIKNIIVSQSEEILLIPQIKKIQEKNEKLEERIDQQNELISKLMDEIYDLKNKN